MESLRACATSQNLTTDPGFRAEGSANLGAYSLEIGESAGGRISCVSVSIALKKLTVDDCRAVCARDLVLAVFRLAVADVVGICYGHDGPIPKKLIRNRHLAPEAAVFLTGPWAAHLADLAGFRLRTLRSRLENANLDVSPPAMRKGRFQ